MIAVFYRHSLALMENDTVIDAAHSTKGLAWLFQQYKDKISTCGEVFIARNNFRREIHLSTKVLCEFLECPNIRLVRAAERFKSAKIVPKSSREKKKYVLAHASDLYIGATVETSDAILLAYNLNSIK